MFGYTDVAGSFCASGGIEVITLDLLSIPVASDSDADGDLLIDSWKRLFGVSSPFADDDGDGYSNLLEMLSGSDPKDARSHPATPPVSLAPPLIHVEIMPTADLKLRWTWPSAYGDRIHFGIRATPALGMPFIELPDTPTHVGDVYEVTLPSPGTGSSFYLVFMALR